MLLGSDPVRDNLDSWGDSRSGDRPGSAVPLLPDLGSLDSNLASRLELSRTALPEVGGTFLGFHLLAELGRGAFGRVFLARQGELANRLVALKISTESLTESQKLAQLQHTHIVPVYSFHTNGPFQAVCMPYFGSTTLADLLRDLQQKQSLPASGKDLVSTLNDRKSQTARTLDSHRSVPVVVPTAATPAPSAPPPDAGVGLQRLEGLTYIEAILWLGARLADGLAHAHEHGILHRDLKPANILLTDDGQPMLLDFNLAEDLKQSGNATTALIGGTLPYMSPEHLAAFQGQVRTVDHRSDIYSLGLILVELLLGRHPFTRFPGPPEAILPRMIAEREAGPPSLRTVVSPAVEAILRRCLDPDPARRYPSARQLQEDLERHLEQLPLKHTPEPSLLERVGKWSRRNPRLTSVGTVATFSLAIVLVLGATLWAWGQRLARHEAQQSARMLTDTVQRARLLLAARPGDQAQHAEGTSVAQTGLDRFGAHPGESPVSLPRALDNDEQAEVRGNLGELLVLLAGREPDPEQALAYNHRAAQWFGTNATPRAVHYQRGKLLEALERHDAARDAFRNADASPVRDAREQTLLAREQLRVGEVQAALNELHQVVRRDPSNVAAWYLLGNATLEAAAHQFARENDAVAAYTACLALAPTFHGLYLNRGLAHLRLRNYAEAEADFSRVLELRQDFAEAYLHRAQALEGLARPKEALADVNLALENGVTSHRALLTRSRLRTQLGDPAGGKADRAEALRRAPVDEESYLARGAARAATDAPGALADFEAAVKLNPRSLGGLHNQAHVLAEHMNNPREAIERLDRVLRFYPRLASGYAGRGVLFARLAERAPALRDARKALEIDPSGETVYQVAGIYALLGDRDRAIRLLAGALRQGYGLDLVDDDPDLKSLKDERRRDEIVKAARILQRTAGQPGTLP